MTPANDPGQSYRWLWFTALYVAGVGALAAVAYAFRALLKLLV